MKTIPEGFYKPYFELFNKEVLEDSKLFNNKLLELEILRKDDSKEEVDFFTNMFHDVLSFFTQPFREENFDFSDPNFFDKIAAIGERYFKDTRTRNMNANRGSRHFIYMNRTFFGLFNLMFDLKAQNIKIENFKSL
ncbi:MAG: hypothetical protein DA407_14460 [Bacteroidetes bacterium]|nr:MAG: hypothetical protein DA407_14460 [Bacteroidota bacterium]